MNPAAASNDAGILDEAVEGSHRLWHFPDRQAGLSGRHRYRPEIHFRGTVNEYRGAG
jgi:hypothetical protein